jgi:hypothetical protein
MSWFGQCQIEECRRDAKTEVSGNTGNSVYLCYTHALEVAEIEEEEKKRALH